MNKDVDATKMVIERIIEGLYSFEIDNRGKPQMSQININFEKNQALEKINFLNKKLNKDFQDKISKLEENFELNDKFLDELNILKSSLPDMRISFADLRKSLDGDLIRKVPELEELE